MTKPIPERFFDQHSDPLVAIGKPNVANKKRSTVQKKEGVSVGDFHAYMPMHSYIFAPSREMWPATSVNARVATWRTRCAATRARSVASRRQRGATAMTARSPV